MKQEDDLQIARIRKVVDSADVTVYNGALEEITSLQQEQRTANLAGKSLQAAFDKLNNGTTRKKIAELDGRIGRRDASFQRVEQERENLRVSLRQRDEEFMTLKKDAEQNEAVMLIAYNGAEEESDRIVQICLLNYPSCRIRINRPKQSLLPDFVMTERRVTTTITSCSRGLRYFRRRVSRMIV